MEKAIDYLLKQKEVQKIVYEGKVTTQTCSNLYLLAQNRMKAGQFEESNTESDALMEQALNLVEEFAEDYATVVSKFYVQQATIKFIMKDYQKALDACRDGIALCKQV